MKVAVVCPRSSARSTQLVPYAIRRYAKAVADAGVAVACYPVGLMAEAGNGAGEESDGIPVDPLSGHIQVDPDGDLSGVRDLGRLLADRLRRDTPDLIHSYSWPLGLVGLIAAEALGLPLAHTASSLAVTEIRHDLTRSSGSRSRAEQLLALSANRLITHNHEDADALRGLGARAEVTVIPYGIDRASVVPIDIRRPRQVPAHLICHDDGTTSSGTFDLLRALTVITSARLTVLVHGRRSAAARARVLDLAGRLNLASRVTVDHRPGAPGHSRLLGAADLAIFPAWHDPIGVDLIEAQAGGAAAVATDVGAHRDVVLPDITGRLVPARMPGHLADAVRKLLADDDLRTAMSLAAVDRARSRYGWDRLGDELARLYSDTQPGPQPNGRPKTAAADRPGPGSEAVPNR